MPLKSGSLHNVLLRIKKSITKKTSPESIRSKELSDDQMVQNAINRSNQANHLNVEDLFQAFGEFSQMYIRSIVMNSFIWGIGELHYRTDHFISQNSKHFRFIDKKGMSYGLKDHEIGNQKYSEHNAYNASTMVSCFGIIGVILALCHYKIARRQLVLQCGLLYAMSTLLFMSTYHPIQRAGMAVTTMLNKAIRVAILMDFGESVPPRLLPVAWTCCYLLTGAMSALCNITLRFTPDWCFLGLGIGILYAIGVILYYFLIPPGVILALAEKRAEDIRAALRKWTDESEEKESLDVNVLIDDTMFQGLPVVSPWHRVQELLTVRPFMFKLLILMMLWTVPIQFGHIGRLSLDDRLALQYYDKMLLFSVFHSIGPIIGAFMVYKFGRRETCFNAMIVGVLSVLVLCHMRLEEFDLCNMNSIPSKNARYVAGFATVIVIMTSSAMEVLLFMLVLHHVPVEQHSILVPLFLIPINVIRTVYSTIEKNPEIQWEGYPNQSYFMALAYSCFCLPLVIFLDNSPHMTLSASHIPCYRFKKTPYPENPIWNDFTAAEQETISESSREV